MQSRVSDTLDNLAGQKMDLAASHFCHSFSFAPLRLSAFA
jgi:hypothetical protein